MSERPVTYRELRNTPSKVFERLRDGQLLELVADGTTKALLIPVNDGDATTARDAWQRGRALLALARLQAKARREDTASLPVSEITVEIRASRKARRDRETS